MYTLYDEIKIKFKHMQYIFNYDNRYKLIQEEKNILNIFNSELDIIYSDSLINIDNNDLIKKLIDKVNFLSEKENQIVNNFNKKGFEGFEIFQKKAKDLQNEKIIQMTRAELFVNLKQINRTIEIINSK